MINSVQSSESSRYTPEVKVTTNYETKTPESNETISQSQAGNEQIPLQNTISGTTQITRDESQKPLVITNDTKLRTVSKFMSEAKTIFGEFIAELSQFAVPTKKAQELT